MGKTIFASQEVAQPSMPIFINPRLHENPFYTGVIHQAGRADGALVEQQASPELKPDWQRAANVFRWAEQQVTMLYAHELRSAMPDHMPSRLDVTGEVVAMPLLLGERVLTASDVVLEQLPELAGAQS